MRRAFVIRLCALHVARYLKCPKPRALTNARSLQLDAFTFDDGPELYGNDTFQREVRPLLLLLLLFPPMFSAYPWCLYVPRPLAPAGAPLKALLQLRVLALCCAVALYTFLFSALYHYFSVAYPPPTRLPAALCGSF